MTTFCEGIGDPDDSATLGTESIQGFTQRSIDAIRQELKDKWSRSGSEARERGTAMHAYAELLMNRRDVENALVNNMLDNTIPYAIKAGRIVSSHLRQAMLTLHKTYKLRPYRTELTIWHHHEGQLVVAGQIDALYKIDGTDKVVLVDWKCTGSDKDKVIDPQKRAYRDECVQISSQPPVPKTSFFRYGLQGWLYAKMLKTSHNIDVHDVYLVQVTDKGHRIVPVPRNPIDEYSFDFKDAADAALEEQHHLNVQAAEEMVADHE